MIFFLTAYRLTRRCGSSLSSPASAGRRFAAGARSKERPRDERLYVAGAPDPGDALEGLLAAVETCLTANEIRSAQVELDGRSYMLAPLGQSQPRSWLCSRGRGPPDPPAHAAVTSSRNAETWPALKRNRVGRCRVFGGPRHAPSYRADPTHAKGSTGRRIIKTIRADRAPCRRPRVRLQLVTGDDRAKVSLDNLERPENRPFVLAARCNSSRPQGRGRPIGTFCGRLRPLLALSLIPLSPRKPAER